MNLLKVSADSKTSAVAGAIAGTIRDHGSCVIQAVGAAAVNQAIKAVTIARSYLREDLLDLAVVPAFTAVEIEGAEKTALRLHVESRPLAAAPVIPVGIYRPLENEPARPAR